MHDTLLYEAVQSEIRAANAMLKAGKQALIEAHDGEYVLKVVTEDFRYVCYEIRDVLQTPHEFMGCNDNVWNGILLSLGVKRSPLCRR
jgi:hypothetical protein